MNHHIDIHLLVLGAWKEACQEVVITRAAANIASTLVKHMPLEQLLVRRIDPERSFIETVATWSSCPDYRPPEARTIGTGPQIESLLEWCRQGEVLRLAGGAASDGLGTLIAPVADREVLAGLLAGPNGSYGVLAVVPQAGCTFDETHLAIVQSLLEPFSAALENDRRLRELNALRAAAEADKSALLAKLGRKGIAEEIVGIESGLRPVMERVELVARSDVPVLVLGETGTGKEMIARLIHQRSPRFAGPFLRVNCGAIPTELIDSQLFGHEKGAFTGAADTRQGWFERADGGTLLLDEIGELPSAAQVRLLRILQDGWLERVGGREPIHVDVRIVAATHRDLAKMVRDGQFREDLWYRIAVFPVFLPPLRERLEDIAALARHFAARAASRFTLPKVMPTAEDIQSLCSYTWPGNIRELATVIDRAAILGNGKSLEVGTALGVSPGQSRAPDQGRMPAPMSGRPGNILPLDAAMKQHIESALAAVRGRIEGPRGVAALLQVNPHTLRARMRKLKIDWVKFRTDGS